MPRVSIKIENTNTLKRIINDRVRFSIIPKLDGKVRDAVRPIIPSLVIDALRQTDVYRGIRGDFAGNPQLDVQAHMGLTKSTADEALNQIEKVILNSIKVNRNRESGLEIIAQNTEQIITNLPIGTYESYDLSGKNTGYLIPWLEWLMEGEGSVQAFIDWNSPSVESSRSERAIMINRASSQNWDVRAYAFGQHDQNFVLRALSDPNFINAATKIIEKEYRNQIKVLNG